MFAATAAMAIAADKVTFDMSDPNVYVDDESNQVTYPTVISNGTSYASGTVFTLGNIKMTLTYADGGGLKAFYTTKKAIEARVYAGATLTFETTDGLAITEINVSKGKNFTSTYFTASTGTLASGKWTGSSKKVVLTCKKSTVTINTMAVTSAAIDGLAAPSFSVAAGTYYEKQTVAITNPNTTGKVYYTTDDSEPTAASTEYTAPVVIEESATLKAIVIDGEKKSAVTSAEYTIADLPEVAGIADFLKLNKGEKAKFKNPIVVAATYKSKGGSVSYYCSDETGGIQLFDATCKIQEYKAKDVIPAGFVAEYDLYNAIPEAINITGLTPATETKDAPFVVTTIEELSTDMVGAVVQVKGAEIKTTDAGFTISDATGTIDGYNKFSIDIAAGKNLLINAVLNVYSGKMQLYPYVISNEGGTDQAGILTESKVEVVPGNGEITVSGSGDVDVYDTEGRRATTVKGSGDYPPKKKTHVIETDPGVYIVVCEGEAVKVLVD